MGIFNKPKEEGNKSSSSPAKEDKAASNSDNGALKNASEELDTAEIKVPSFPGTEKRVTVVAVERTKYHKKGEEFSIPETNLGKMEKQGYKLKK